jgi:hypothetical protein
VPTQEEFVILPSSEMYSVESRLKENWLKMSAPKEKEVSYAGPDIYFRRFV